jgi:hypothetical protein
MAKRLTVTPAEVRKGDRLAFDADNLSAPLNAPEVRDDGLVGLAATDGTYGPALFPADRQITVERP